MTRHLFNFLGAAAWCGALGSALFITGCSKPAVPDPDVLAKVGTQEIRTGDLRAEAERRRQLGHAVPEKGALLQELIQYDALVQRAKSAGLDKDPQVARELGNLLVAKLLERDVEAKSEAVTVTNEEIRAEYEKNLAKYTEPGKVRFSVLFLESSPGSSDAKKAETRARLEEGLRKFKEAGISTSRNPAQQGFGSLALQYSDDSASRYRGGDIGWLNDNEFTSRWPKPVLAAGFALKKGAVSDLIQTDAGFYLVLKTDARESRVHSLKDAEPALRHNLLVAKRRQLDEDFRHESERLAGVTLHEKALASFDLPRPERALAKSRNARPPEFPATAPVAGGHP